jgi:hypothetical protein
MPRGTAAPFAAVPHGSGLRAKNHSDRGPSGRALGLYLEEGVDPPPLMAEPSDSEDGYLRVPRVLPKHQKEALHAGASQPLRLRRG